MCGIVGYNGKGKNTLNILIDGLKALEYRGYDSAGVAFREGNDTKMIKSVGKISELEKKLNKETNSSIGIGHTRWATHGIVSEINSHPHNVGDVTIVHNGIIENFNELKNMLKNNGYIFNTTTDTEVACALIDFYYNDTKDIKKSLLKFMDTVKGSYALGVMVNGLDIIYSVRKDSPLIIATSKNGNFIASDTIAVSKYADDVMYLDEGIIAEIRKDSINLYDRSLNIINGNFKPIDKSIDDYDKHGYEHYMLKEISEQPKVFRDTVSNYLKDDIDDLLEKMPDFTKYNRIDIVACGSAYHTGLVGKSLIEEFAGVQVNVEIASEYRYKKNNFYDDKTLVIVVSQSGETADTLAALRKAKNDGIDTLAIVNVKNSTMAREADTLLSIEAGREIAVATTKAYSAQVAMLSLIALNLATKKGNIDTKEIKQILKDIKELPVKIESVINTDYSDIVDRIYENENIFFIGRGVDYALCMEGSLKLKEISYINSQAYAAGELKHGTISLIDEGTPVIGILTEEDLILKTISNIEEVKSRGAVTIGVTNENIKNDFDYLVNVPKVHKLLQPLLTVIPLQLISYGVAKKRDCDIDKPKNLAKSVTVE